MKQKPSQFILDTDILSMIMRRNPIVIPKARSYLNEHDKFALSIITKYEILRGLKVKDAVRQIKSFELFCTKNTIIPITDEIIVKASDIYAYLVKRGEKISDADILIAASALINDLGLITNNEKHFCRINELYIVNWLNDY